MDTVLILIGVACVIGAIIGGGIKMQVIEMRSFESLWRQFVLAVFGAGLILFGLNMRKEIENNSFNAANTVTANAQPAEPAGDSPAPAEPDPAKQPEPKPAETGHVPFKAVTTYVRPK